MVAIRVNLAIALLNTAGRTADAVVQLQTVLPMDFGNPTGRQILAQVPASPPLSDWLEQFGGA